MDDDNIPRGPLPARIAAGDYLSSDDGGSYRSMKTRIEAFAEILG